MHVADDAAAQKFALDHLRKLAAAAREAKAKLLGLLKTDGSADVMTYSLGKGNTYLKRFRSQCNGSAAGKMEDSDTSTACCRSRQGRQEVPRGREEAPFKDGTARGRSEYIQARSRPALVLRKKETMALE